ncbi:hypothetical protein GCM10009738_64660 [Kitasatospora viridis]
MREFLVLISALSDEARFPRALAAQPVEADSPTEIAAVFGSYLGPGAHDVGVDSW